MKDTIVYLFMAALVGIVPTLLIVGGGAAAWWYFTGMQPLYMPPWQEIVVISVATSVAGQCWRWLVAAWLARRHRLNESLDVGTDLRVGDSNGSKAPEM